MDKLKLVKQFYKSLPGYLRLILAEGWPVIIVLFGVLIELRHIADSGWLYLFLYHSDSLTLSVLRESLANKEQPLWVFSSQFTLFPEGLFYALSAIVAVSMRGTLVLNAALNVTVLYVLFRLTALSIHTFSVIRQRLFALCAVFILLLEMLLEGQPYINQRSLATLFLFTTYYYGVVIVGLAVIAISLAIVRGSKLLSSRRFLCLGALNLIIASLATFSNPLFIVQFLLPFLIAAVCVLILSEMHFKDFLRILVPPFIGSAIGYLARSPFKNFIGQSIGSHIATDNIPSTLTAFHFSLSAAIHSKSGLVEVLLCFDIIGFSLLYATYWVYRKTHNKKLSSSLDPYLLLLCLFAVIEPLIIIFVSIVSGTITTRYLMPMFIFPLLGLLPLAKIPVSKKLRRLVAYGFWLLGTIVVVLGILSIAGANKLLSPSTYIDNGCLSTTFDGKAAYGVGSYWTVRALDVYGQDNEEAFQVTNNLSVFPWLANLGSYNKKRFTFIVVDKNPTTNSFLAIPSNDPAIPAHPSRISSCRDIYIYQYATGSIGYKQLNNDIDQSYARFLKFRSSGTISEHL